MLAKIQRTFSQFFSGENSENVPRNRKRSLESDGEEEVTPTPLAKRLKPDPGEAAGNQRWGQQLPLSKVAEWVVRNKTSWTDKYHIRGIWQQASPKALFGRLRRLATSPSNGVKTESDTRHQQNPPVMFRVPPFNRQDSDPTHIHPPQVSSTPVHIGPPSPPESSFIRPNWPSDYSMHSGKPPNMDRMAPRPAHSSLIRPSISTGHQFGYQQSVYDKTFADKGASAQRNQERKSWQRNRGKMMAQESVRLDEKSRYASLLQSFQHRGVPTTMAGSLAPIRGNTSLFHPGHRLDRKTPSSSLYSSKQPSPTVDLTKDGEVSIIKVVADRPASKPDITERSFINLSSKRSQQDSDPEVIDLSSEESQSSIASQEKPLPKPEDQSERFVDLTTPRTTRAGVRRIDTPTKSNLNKTSLQTPVKPESAKQFEKAVKSSPYVTEGWIKDLTGKYSCERREREHWVKQEEVRLQLIKEKRDGWEKNLEEKLRKRLSLAEREPAIFEETFPEDADEEDEFPELTPEVDDIIDSALARGPPGQVLGEGFKLKITRQDLATLAGLNWLNDEVINFYMSLLMDRCEKDESLPKVYAFNSFFYPKLINGGHSSLRRWTKRVDIFAYDYILAPVHLGMHWCLSVVDFRKKQVRYYDSMGGKNQQCLDALRDYLAAEHRDKKQSMLDTNSWKLINVKKIPQQMNGSDCGMFTCKYAEYITKDAPITFGQEHMPYFRRRMVYEIIIKKLL